MHTPLGVLCIPYYYDLVLAPRRGPRRVSGGGGGVPLLNKKNLQIRKENNTQAQLTHTFHTMQTQHYYAISPHPTHISHTKVHDSTQLDYISHTIELFSHKTTRFYTILHNSTHKGCYIALQTRLYC